MTPGTRTAAFTAMIVLSAATAPAAEPDLTRWTHVAPVQLETAPAAGLVEFALPPDVFARGRPDLADLRLSAADGSAVPYVLRVDRGEVGKAVSYKPARVFNAIFTPGVSSTVTVDFGARAKRTRVRIGTPGGDFRRRVKVEAGEDGRTWQVLRETAWLFRVGRWGRDYDKSWVKLPDNDFRYLRITVFNAPDDPRQIPIEVVTARYVKGTPPRTAAVEVRSTRVSQKPKIKATEVEADLGWENLPLHELALSVEDGSFLRRVEILGRNQKTRIVEEIVEDAPPRKREVPVPWRRITSGTIHHFPAVAREAASKGLTLGLDGQYRYLLVRIFNEDNQPLTFKGLTVRRLQYYVGFQPTTRGPYQLYLGRPKALKPQYDLVHFVDRLRAEGVTKASLGDVAPNPSFAHEIKPVPWSERWKWLLWLALIGVGVVLALLVIRQAKQAKTAD